MEILKIKDLHVSVEEKEILAGINLTINEGETHVIMGPNGAGKSTLVNTIMAHPNYHVTKGELSYKEKDILDNPVDQRARDGIFMSFQQAYEVPGITLENFIRASKSAVTGKQPSILQFRKALYAAMDELNMDHSYASRYLNVGFSGGEKKKSEVLQMLMLDPTLAMLDETDSGLDVDAVKVVSEGVNSWMDDKKAILLITHHDKVLEALHPQFVHILMDGKFVMDGGPELIDQISQNGYQWIKERV